MNTKHSIISIDLAKNIFQVCALNAHNKVVINKKVSRKKLLATLSQFEPTEVVMEACYSAHHWGRAIAVLGHTVKLIPPYQVKPFVVGNKNDHNDAIAIAEAAHRPKASFVPVKTLEQQDIQSLQRIRERLIRQRSATSNQLRGLLAEYGIILPTGLYRLRKGLPDILEDAQQPLTPVARKFIQMLYQELLAYDKRIQETENETIALLQTDEDYQRLQTIPGVGPIIAANMLAAVGDAKYFKNGRQMAAWIGLTPKQHASGEISRLSGISKRGNSHLRRLLIHGACTVLNWSGAKTDKLSLWLQALSARAHPCKVIVALANKLARIIWAVLAHKQNYQAT
ncbi:IS110 family transposase [Candidatus Venteria ishoeyi]|uniref:IS110 family transposase n=1 Tax=Candidatus Venteria ishoeyi TaxID=1899563 RepID=UPI0025A638F2|nr:IS110 family transposase [Candidatus Venteria ishoeyi]MDM8547536.1 IS110 family transposase [Candidatus Venteria ishoeyi]